MYEPTAIAQVPAVFAPAGLSKYGRSPATLNASMTEEQVKDQAEVSDRELVDRARSGSAPAFDELVLFRDEFSTVLNPDDYISIL